MSPRRAIPEPEPEVSAPALAFVGRGRYRGVPARDLDEHDLARLAYRRALSATGTSGKRPDPRNPNTKVLNELMAELTSSGLYVPKEAESDG